MTEPRASLWIRTKEVASTYTGTFIVVMILNQLLFFGFCLNPICLIAAMPHVLLITVAVGTFINKMSGWGNRRLVSRTSRVMGKKAVEIGKDIDLAVTKFEEAATEFNLETKKFRDKEIERRKKQRMELQRQIEELDARRGLTDGQPKRVDAPDLASSLELLTPTTGIQSIDTPLYEKFLDRLSDGKTASVPPSSGIHKESTDDTFKKTIQRPDSIKDHSSVQPKAEKSLTNKHTNGFKYKVPKAHVRAYITNNNLSKILKSLNAASVPSEEYDKLYKDNLRSILSHKELALLCVYKEVCEDPSQALEFYGKIRSKPDNFNFVYKSANSSYHLDRNCDLLHGDYFNLKIPSEIEAKGKKEISRFTEFCLDNRKAIENEEEVVFIKMEALFFLKNRPKRLIAKNSGVAELTNMNLEVLEKRIDQILVDAEAFRTETPEHTKVIKDLGYADEAIGLKKDPDNPIHIWNKTYKIPLKQLLRDYFRVKFNSDLAFEGSLLEQLGFKPCQKCSSGFIED